jgi:hypothetical protein
MSLSRLAEGRIGQERDRYRSEHAMQSMWISGTDKPGKELIAARVPSAPASCFPYLSVGIIWILLLGTGSMGCSPRVKVEAPDKPIEINVNVKIEQEVRIKLDKAVERTLEENPELFGTETRP